jgi:hypothetical protein
MYKPNIEARLSDHCCREKAVSITSMYIFLSVVVLIWRTKRMSRIKLSSVACLGL